MMQSCQRPLAVVILAAGAGTRMRSATPKPLHVLGGASLLAHVLRTAAALEPARLVVVTGNGGEAVAAAARSHYPGATIVTQEPQLGTGHAVRCALPALEGFSGDVVVLYADTPFVAPDTLRSMMEARARGAAVVVLGFEAVAPGSYGRLVFNTDSGLARIVEAADASPTERMISLCNSGVMAFDCRLGAGWLNRLSNANAKGEYYLTDLVAAARAEGRSCAVVTCPEAETMGVNSRADLAAAEAAFQHRARSAAMEAGVTLTDPATVFLAFDTALECDVVIGPNVVFGAGVRVENGVRINAFCHLEGCVLRAGAEVGPFARLRPGADIGPRARIGNFVEIKNAVLGEGAKANHLSYLGDATIGAGANIGAGTITCNYDGYLKHHTEIGAGAFIGSNSALVAPVRSGAGAYVGSGAVVTQDVAADALAIARARQVNKPGLAARLRARLADMKATKRN